MKVFVTGGTGLIGKQLVFKLLERNYEVTVLSRNKEKTQDLLPDMVNVIEGNPAEKGAWQNELNNTDIVINLAGEPVINKRWDEKVKKELYDSRINATKNIVEAISKAENKPSLLINASAVGYYGFQNDDREIDETETYGKDFLATLCNDWEFEAKKVQKLEVRNVNLRIGIVLSDKGGALEKMLIPFKLYVGGYTGNGKQWLPWIHLDDVVGLILFSIDSNISGSINVTAPQPVKMKEFAQKVGDLLKRPSFFPVPSIALKSITGEVGDVITSGQRAIPSRALQAGYEFEFKTIQKALDNLIAG